MGEQINGLNAGNASTPQGGDVSGTAANAQVNSATKTDSTSNAASTVFSAKHLLTSGGSAAGIAALVAFVVANSAGTATTVGQVSAIGTVVTAGHESSAVTISTRVDGGALTEQLRVGSPSGPITYGGGTVVTGYETRDAGFTTAAGISRVYLIADGLAVMLDNALPVGTTVELWHRTSTVAPAHTITSGVTGDAGSGTVESLPSTAAAASLTWPAGQGVLVCTQVSAGAWSCQ